MARKRDRAASRDAGFTRLLMTLALCTAGLGCGIILGRLAVGEGLRGIDEPEASYAALSANPAARTAASVSPLNCLDCTDGYGVATRWQTIRTERSGDAYRALGAVEPDYPPPDEPADDYRYGGRFPDAGSPLSVDRPPIVAADADEAPTGIVTDDAPRPDVWPSAAAPD